MIRSRAMASTPRFLVGIDFSDGSRHALDEARRLAARCHASLTVAHVRPVSDMRAAVAQNRGDLVHARGKVLAGELAKHYEERIAQWVGPSDGERALILSGAPEVVLTKEATRGYTMLVLGTTGLNAVSSLLMGSTVERVISRATVPVLAVPVPRRNTRKSSR